MKFFTESGFINNEVFGKLIKRDMKDDELKGYKTGLNKALVLLRDMKKYDLCWEWMEENKDGEYIIYDNIKEMIIKELNDDLQGNNGLGFKEAKYKLKKDARHFFDKKLGKEVLTLNKWESVYKIPIELLEVVNTIFITYGKPLGKNGTSVSSYDWQNEEGEIYFTLNIKEIDHELFESFSLPDLMDEMQKTCNSFFYK